MSAAALVAGEAARLLDELDQLVAISTPSGDIPGTEQVLALCQDFLPAQAVHERVACATAGCAPDLISLLTGTGTRKILLLGHVDTVVAHAMHQPLRRDGERLYGSGTSDMKGGVVIALALARILAQDPERYAELALLLVCDEEWRNAPFAHLDRFAGYDACLCFEAGERTPAGEHGVVTTRKGAGTLRVYAHGRAAHSGSAPWNGRNALLALAAAAIDVERHNDPQGPFHLTVVPTVMNSGGATNVVPASGELIFDMRASDVRAFTEVYSAVPKEISGVTLEAVMERIWPAMNSDAATVALLDNASSLYGAPIVKRARGGASDASHFAALIPLTVDGLGPLGGGAHTPQEFVYAESLAERTAVALAVAQAALGLS